MRKRKAVLNQREDGRKDSAAGKVKEPETPEDKKGEKLHLFHPF
jgi:hypothetical protein